MARISTTLAAATTMALVACGSDDDRTIPREQAKLLLADLEQVQAAVDDGACDTAKDAADGFRERADALPAEVDGDVKQALLDGGRRLEELAQDSSECEADTGTEETTVQPPPPPAPPDEEEEEKPPDRPPSEKPDKREKPPPPPPPEPPPPPPEPPPPPPEPPPPPGDGGTGGVEPGEPDNRDRQSYGGER